MKSKNQEKSLANILTNTQTNIGTSERVVSAVGGGALLTYGLKRGDTLGVMLSILGGGLALRGATGHCQVYDALGIDSNDKSTNPKSPFDNSWVSGKIHVTKAVTINKSPAELYQFWRNFENLPKFMSHLESVTVTGEKTSFWKAKAPLGTTVEWNAEITSEQENQRIGWKSVEGSDIPNSGVVEFNPTSTRGTEVRVLLTYESPAGELGAIIAKLFGEEPSQQVYGDLYRFKSLMESGEIITVEGQTSGREPQAKKASA
ncbi:MAG: DUF2892 domain-containing protein [Acidobacteria bacterium]|jgi:uncharacterized membrane protein|nr:DUF2892 domain-containing protein [Acidobacteriota bacterium]